MPALSPSALRKQISAGKTDPLYALVGDDDIEKSAVAAEFTEMIDEGLRAFNVDHVYGAEASADDVIDAAATLPMMAPRRVVIVLEAEKLLIPKRDTKAAEEELERLQAFIEAPQDHASVIFVCGSLDMRRRVVKLLLKEAHVVDCGSIEDADAADRWVKTRAARDGLNLEPAAVRALIDRAGLDIARLRAGLERVGLYAMGQPHITPADVREAVPPGPDAQAEFGIANAIARNDPADALHELKLALDAGSPPYMVLGQLRVAAERLPAAQLQQGMSALLRTDIALKSSGGDQRILLERLVVELCGKPGSGRKGAWGR